MLFKVLIAIAAIFLLFSIIGFLVKLAVWAIVIGLVIFVISALLGWAKRSKSSGSFGRAQSSRNR